MIMPRNSHLGRGSQMSQGRALFHTATLRCVLITFPASPLSASATLASFDLIFILWSITFSPHYTSLSFPKRNAGATVRSVCCFFLSSVSEMAMFIAFRLISSSTLKDCILPFKSRRFVAIIYIVHSHIHAKCYSKLVNCISLSSCCHAAGDILLTLIPALSEFLEQEVKNLVLLSLFYMDERMGDFWYTSLARCHWH